MSQLTIKEAEGSIEMQQIHALNHRVFAEEIAQHKTNPSGLLIDHLHRQNRYFVAVRDGVVVGMISVNAGPEFSIAKRLRDVSVLREFPRPVEVRLLAIDPQERRRTLLAGLLWQVYHFALSNGFSHLLISAIAHRESMYRKLGFQSLGAAVPEGDLCFTPMVRPVIEKHKAGAIRVDLYKRYWQRITSKSGVAERRQRG